MFFFLVLGLVAFRFISNQLLLCVIWTGRNRIFWFKFLMIRMTQQRNCLSKRRSINGSKRVPTLSTGIGWSEMGTRLVISSLLWIVAMLKTMNLLPFSMPIFNLLLISSNAQCLILRYLYLTSSWLRLYELLLQFLPFDMNSIMHDEFNAC